MNLSYWEFKSWFSNVDFTIIGSGIVGLNCALFLREKYPKATILVLEKGILPQGASTKNAGFACFGSLSEILADLEHHSEEEVVELTIKRWQGIQLLRKNLGDENIDFQRHGGHELFLDRQKALYQKCLSELDRVNTLLVPVFGEKAFYLHDNAYNFKNVHPHYITHRFEGQIDTGKMMSHLLELVRRAGIRVLNGLAVHDFEENGRTVEVKTEHFEFCTKKLCVTTNGFASQLIGETVKPARAQVVVTKPIEELAIKGTFHFDEGYYYFRNIDNRILFGGGRNIDLAGEETMTFGQTEAIQNRLEAVLRETILPNTPFEIEKRWSGIMGVGPQKKPIVKQLSDHVYCGVRLGGMGIAIGSLVGKELAELV